LDLRQRLDEAERRASAASSAAAAAEARAAAAEARMEALGLSGEARMPASTEQLLERTMARVRCV
jgi:hypothetical protein